MLIRDDSLILKLPQLLLDIVTVRSVPAWLLRKPLLTLVRSAPFALRWGRLRRLRGWFLASLNGRRIPRDVPDQMILHGVLEQRLV